MSQIFNEEDLEAVLFIDVSNAFNAVNRNLPLHNVSAICSEIAVFVRNCYSLPSPSRFFIIGGSELKSREETTQGNLAAMAIYPIATIPLLLMLVDQVEQLLGKRMKSVAYADDFTLYYLNQKSVTLEDHPHRINDLVRSTIWVPV